MLTTKERNFFFIQGNHGLLTDHALIGNQTEMRNIESVLQSAGHLDQGLDVSGVTRPRFATYGRTFLVRLEIKPNVYTGLSFENTLQLSKISLRYKNAGAVYWLTCRDKKTGLPS